MASLETPSSKDESFERNPYLRVRMFHYDELWSFMFNERYLSLDFC